MKSVTELILSVADRISLPLGDSDRFDSTAVLRVMNEVMDEQVSQKLIAEGMDYLIHRLVLPLNTNGLPTYPTMRIPLPIRTVGRGLRDIKYIADQGGGNTERRYEINVTQTSLTEADSYTDWNNNYFARNPMIYMENDNIQLLGNPSSVTGYLVLYYFLEPSTMINQTTGFAAITDATFLNGTTTFTANVGTEYGAQQVISSTAFTDLYRAQTGAILRPNVKLTRATATTFTTTDLNEVEVNELRLFQNGAFPVVAPHNSEIYILPAGKSQFSTIPWEFDHILVLETCSRILESLGDNEGLAVVAEMLKKAEQSIDVTMGNRLTGQRKRVTDKRNIASFQRNRSLQYRG